MLKQPIHVCEDSDLTNLESEVRTFQPSMFIELEQTSNQSISEHTGNSAIDLKFRFNANANQFRKEVL